MQNGKKVFWGMFFILAAVAVIAGGMGYFPGIDFWSIILTVGFAAFLIMGIAHRSFGSILFPLAFLAILYDEYLGIEQITPWPVLGAALLGTIGLKVLFPNVGKHKWKKGHFGKKSFCGEQHGAHTTEDNPHYEVCFGESVKYADGELSYAHLKCSFGSLIVYVNNAALADGEAEIFTETGFGCTAIYVPADWNVVMDVQTFFAGTEEKGKHTPAGENTLRIRGEVSFGALEIHYI